MVCVRVEVHVDVSVALTMVVAMRHVDVATSIRTAKYLKTIKFDLNTV
jgi:hypothetical protein